MKAALISIAALTLILAGCADNRDDNLAYLSETVNTLKEANYSGQFTFSTDGKVGVGSTQSFWIGPPSSIIAVNGQVNFNPDE